MCVVVNALFEHASTAVEIDNKKRQHHDGKKVDETTTVRFGRADNNTSSDQSRFVSVLARSFQTRTAGCAGLSISRRADAK